MNVGAASTDVGSSGLEALLLEVEDLRVRVGEHEVLKGINLAIREGETHVLLSAAQVIATRGAFRPRNPRAA